MSRLVKSKDYRAWMVSIKQRIQSAQIKAALSVNQELMNLYWFLGEQIIEKQKSAIWGDGFLKQMSQDLQAEFPEIKGFSVRNLKYMRQWLRFWAGSSAIGQQVVAQLGANWSQLVATMAPSADGQQLVNQNDVILRTKQFVSQLPRGHNGVLIQKLSKPAEALFFVQKTIQTQSHREHRAAIPELCALRASVFQIKTS